MAAANNGGGSSTRTTTPTGMSDELHRSVKRPRITTQPSSSYSQQPPQQDDSNYEDVQEDVDEGEEDEDQESEEEGEGDGNVEGEYDDDDDGEEEDEEDEDEDEEENDSDRDSDTEFGNEEEEEDVEVREVEKAAEHGGDRGGGGDEFVFFMKDVDVLDCPICTDPLTIPVYQCENGHVACSSCCFKIKNKCPSCSQSIGYSRCRAIEKVVESVQVLCQNSKYGCNERMLYSEKNKHELTCIFAPCSCPTPGCDYVGLPYDLYHHYTTKHHAEFETFTFDSPFHVCVNTNVKHVVLVEKNGMKIFVVNHARTVYGSLVNIDCIKRSGSIRRYLYSLSNVNGDNSMVFKALAENVPNWVEHVPRGASLMVSRDSFNQDIASGNVDIEVCIKKDIIVPVTSWRMP